MIVYDKEQKQIVIPNGLGNVNIIINQGCDDDKPTPPQDGWGMTGIFNNWGDSPDIPFKENGEWDGRPYKVIRNFGATGGEFKIRRNNAWTDSYTASFHNEPQFAQLLKNDFSMSIDDGIWDIYLFFGNDGEPNEMLILRPGTNLSTIQYEYTLTISTDKENAIIEIADSYRRMTDRYCGDVTVTMKYGCIYFVNVYMEGYENISDKITCHNNEERNYTLTKKKYNTIADIYGSPSNSIVTFKGLVALSFDYAKLNRGDYILFTDHTGSIILKKCQKPLKVGDECLVTATLRRYNDSYIPTLFYYDGSSVEVLSSNNYVVMPTDAVELTNLNDLYIPNENGYAEMKYLYADGTVVKAPSDNFMRIETEATKPDNITLRGDLSDWEGKLAKGDNVRVYMFPEANPNTFWVTDIIELGEEDGSYNKGYEQGKADVVTKARVLNVTENGVYKSKFSDPIVPEIVTGVYADGTNFYSYAELNRKVFNTKIAATIDSRLEFWYKGDNTALGFGDNVIIGAGNNDDNNCFQVRYYEGFNGWVKISVGNSTIDVNNWNDTVWHHLIISKAEGLWVDGEKKGDFTASNTVNGKFYINGAAYDTARNANGTFGMIKIDDVVIIPTADGFINTNTGELLQVVKDGTYTFTENLPIYGEGELYKTINVNIDVDSYYNNGYNQGKTDGVNEQKSKLESISITENGTYRKEDGYNEVVVNVPDLNGSYDEGYSQGHTEGYNEGKTDGINEQKGKLTQITISENGTYANENGYSEVVVNVPDLNGSYDEGYNQGKIDGANEQKSKLETINITENGTYRKEDGYNEIVVDVPSSSVPKINVKEAGLKFAYSEFTEVPEWADFKGVTDMARMFRDCTNLQTISPIDTSNVTNMNYMFYNCSSLQTIPQLDTSNVTDMSNMFYSCGSLQTIPQLDTSNVTNMLYMFGYCGNLQTIPQLDTSNVTNMDSMFGYCGNLQTIPQLDTSNVTNMNYMFVSCTSLVSIPALNAQKLSMSQYYSLFGRTELLELTDLGGFLNLKSSLTSDGNLKRLPNLTYESCINVLNGLYDFTGNGETPNSNQGRLKVAQSFIDKVGDKISIGVAKGWSISA